MMAGLGLGEILLIGVLGLIFVGPQKIPELARSLGRGLREFRRAKDELQEELTTEKPCALPPSSSQGGQEKNQQK